MATLNVFKIFMDLMYIMDLDVFNMLKTYPIF